MSMRGEVRDFLSAALAVRKSFRDDDNSDARNNYYKALIANSQANQALSQKRLDLAAQSQRDNLGLRREALGQSAAHHKDSMSLQSRHLDQVDRQLNMKDKDQLGLENATRGAVPANTVPSANAPAAPGPVSENTELPENAEPTAGAVPEAISGSTVSPGAAYDTDEREDDPDEETQNFAGGGAVEAGTPAVNVEDTPDAASKEGVADQGTGSLQTQGGFSVKDALDSWEQGNTQTGVQAPAQQGAVNTSQTPDAPPKQDNPVAIGLKGIMQTYGLGQERAALPGTGPQGDGVKRLAKSEGAASDEEVKAMNKAVDPADELNESARTVARLDAGVKFWLSRGEPQKASKLAQSLLMYGKVQSEKFGNYAAAAAQKGDLTGAASFLDKAYDYIPDGNRLEAKVADDGKIHAQVVDQRTGDKSDLGAFDAPQVYKFALGVKDGSMYMQNLVQVAQGRPSVAKGDAPMKVNDFNRVTKNVGDEYDSFATNNKLQLAPATSDAIKNSAVHLFSDPMNRRSGMTANEAMSTAAQIALPDPKNPTTPNFKVKIGNGGAMVMFNDGRQAFVPRPQFDQLVALRAEKMKGMKPAQQSDKPGFAQGLGDAVNKAAPNGYMNDIEDPKDNSIYQGMKAGG